MKGFHAADMLDTLIISAIGRIVAEWALCETMISVAIWDMLGVTWEQGHILTDDMTAATRLRTFRALAADKYEDQHPVLYEETENLFKRLDACNTERNHLAHNVWSSSGHETFASNRYTSRSGRFKITANTKTSEEFLDLVSRIESLTEDLDKFISAQRRR